MGSEGIVRGRRLIRVVLAYFAITGLMVSAWALVAPRGFYDDFPLGSAEWVSVLPPYNEHLVRDYASALLGLTVLAATAAVLMERRLVQVTLVVLFVGVAPHLAYHLTTTESYSTTDNMLSLGGLALQSILPLMLLALTADRRSAVPHRPKET